MARPLADAFASLVGDGAGLPPMSPRAAALEEVDEEPGEGAPTRCRRRRAQRARPAAQRCCARRGCFCDAPLPYDVSTNAPLFPAHLRRPLWGRRPVTSEVIRGAPTPDIGAQGGDRSQTAPSPSEPPLWALQQSRRASSRNIASLVAGEELWGHSPTAGGGRSPRLRSRRASLVDPQASLGDGQRASKTKAEEGERPGSGSGSVVGALPRIRDGGALTSRDASRSRPKMRSSVEVRLDRLSGLAAQKAGAMHSRSRRKAQFEALPHEEREMLAWAFESHDLEAAGVLDAVAVASCCWEVGLGGNGPDEKAAVHRVCAEEGGSIDMYDFALETVPRVRARLAEMRHGELLRQFRQRDPDGTGFLSRAQCLSMTRAAGLDSRDMWDMTEQSDDKVDFKTLQAVMNKSRQKLLRTMRRREYEVKEFFMLDEDTFRRFRRDLIQLHDAFFQYDIDESGSLGHAEVFFMVKDLGLMPKTRRERTMVENIISEADADLNHEFDFTELLNVVDLIRLHRQSIQREDLRVLFERYDHDRSGALSVAEISALLANMGIMPYTRAEQEELADLILSADDDGSGTIGFEEFLTLCQQIEEKVNRMRYEHEIDVAISLGFTEAQLRDFKWVFDMMDTDGSGRLDLEEIHGGLLIMERPISQGRVARMIRRLDSQQRASLDFSQFLGLMQILHEEDGSFLNESRAVNVEAYKLEPTVMRRVLEMFKMPKAYIAAVSKEDLVDLFCRYFQIKRKANVRDVLGVKTVPELFKLAKSKEAFVRTLRRT